MVTPSNRVTLTREYTDGAGRPVTATITIDEAALERWYKALASKAYTNGGRAAVGQNAIVVTVAVAAGA